MFTSRHKPKICILLFYWHTRVQLRHLSFFFLILFYCLSKYSALLLTIHQFHALHKSTFEFLSDRLQQRFGGTLQQPDGQFTNQRWSKFDGQPLKNQPPQRLIGGTQIPIVERLTKKRKPTRFLTNQLPKYCWNSNVGKVLLLKIHIKTILSS